jgi:CubicO group peptidase (beta-lactamase class C family)
MGVAMLTFYEEGNFKPDDPVSKRIPEFANLKVKGATQKIPMIISHLMSHSVGFFGPGHGHWHNLGRPATKRWQRAVWLATQPTTNLGVRAWR